MSRTDGRTHYEATIDVRYGMRFNELNARLYNHIDGAISFITMLGTCGAAVSFVNQSPPLAAASGLLLAAVAALGRVIGPARKAEQHAAACRNYAAIDAAAADLTLEQIDARLRPLQASSPGGFRLLAAPAYLDNLRSNGIATDLRLTRAQAIAYALA